IIYVIDLFQVSAVSVYPNPSNGYVYIDVANNSLKIASIEVFDLMGKSQLKKMVNTARMQLNLQYLPQGIYLLKFANDKGNKVIKWIKK
ncbi:MAG: T9SS type A sorting domain-containing protein, partial [Flavobacteriales bacterium]|nr:T9SS type A sorting domain-containing protein [Flavobacteriales bacterium]